MRVLDTEPMHYRVADFLKWQRERTLDLNPPFQRRSVWKPVNRAFLIDTIVRGLPVPLLFVRERLNLDSQEVVREVVDGQQRLRTLFIYIDSRSLKDYVPERDDFTVSSTMNDEIAGAPFDTLSPDLQERILGYKFSVRVLPTSVEDRDILEIFARLNSTGTQLNYQELRNAEFFGEFKVLMYRLAYEQLDRWRSWRILSDDQISRMLEVQLVSDLVINMLEGVRARSQPGMKRYYKDHDETLKGATEIGRRFRGTMDVIDELFAESLADTVYSSEVHFFSLFIYLYDRLWGLGSEVKANVKPAKLPTGLKGCLLKVSDSFRDRDVPEQVLDAVQRASTDVGRRTTRLVYMKQTCGG